MVRRVSPLRQKSADSCTLWSGDRLYVWIVASEASWRYRYTCFTHWAARRATSVTALHFHAPSGCVYLGDELGTVCVCDIRSVLAATRRLLAAAEVIFPISVYLSVGN